MVINGLHIFLWEDLDLYVKEPHKVGTTSTGMVIVEMSAEQFDALSKISAPAHPRQESNEAACMSFADKIDFVKPRITKLGPKNIDSLKNGLKNIFNFTGGISDIEVDKIINKLKKDKIIFISTTNKVTYCES